MAAHQIAGRLRSAWQASRTSSRAAGRLDAIAATIEIASQGGAADGEEARDDLSAAISCLRAELAQLPEGDENQLMALSLLAEACLLRDGDGDTDRDGDGNPGSSDLDEAIGCARRVCAGLAAGSPDRVYADVTLGRALLTRSCRAGGRLTHLDEAGAQLELARGGLAPDDPDRLRVAALLAVQRAVRYGFCGGTGADRDEALELARDCLAFTDADGADDVRSTGHIVSAWMTLTRNLTAAQRSSVTMRGDVEAARSGAQAASPPWPQPDELEITPADAAAAMTHLRQLPDPAGIEPLGGFVPMIWSLALLVSLSAEASSPGPEATADVPLVAGGLARAAALAGPGTPEHSELLAMRAVLLAAQARAPGAGESVATAANALTEAATGLPAGHRLRPPVLEVLRETFSRQVAAARDSDDIPAELAKIWAAIDQMPPGDPAMAQMMTRIGMEMLSASLMKRSARQDMWLVPRLQRLASRLAPDDPLRPLARYMEYGIRLADAHFHHRPKDAELLLEELARHVNSVPAGYIARPYMLAGLAAAYVDRHGLGGEVRHLRQADEFIDRAFEEADPDGPFGERGAFRGLLQYIRGHLRVVWSYYDPSPERVAAAISDLEPAAALREAADAGPAWAVSALETARLMQDDLLANSDQPALGPEARQAFDKLLEAAGRAGPQDADYPVLVCQAATGLILRGLADTDITLIDRAIRMLAEAANLQDLAVRERPRLLESHGFALITRYSRTQQPADLANGIERLEEARRAVEQEVGSPRAAAILQKLASAYRMRGNAARGDVDRAVIIGLAGLREHAGDVFLQDSDENALHIARAGVSDATEMARWFLARGREEEAVSAVELGRGMVLHAATSGAGVQQILREAGHTGLADEWARCPARTVAGDADGTGDLRYRIMLATEESPAQRQLTSPPAVGEIAAALTATGTHALAYLLPRGDDGQGLALIVDSHGHVRSLPLPGLYLGGGSVAGALLRARPPARTAGGAPMHPARTQWLDTLGDLCDWAWGAAMGPLLRAIPARGAAAERRIVLVPTGELGLVPWHAARERRSGRHACQQAVFTYAASARQFVETAQRRARPWAQDAVLISDAGESEYLTAVGIAYLHAAHYPAGTVFGYAREKLTGPAPGAAAATPADVLAALPGTGFPGASLLHFGCHGRAEVPALGSMLTLGRDGDGSDIKVEVRHILGQARAGRTGNPARGSAGGLVVLASCLTDLTERDFDEALTLATAFLSAGATGVVAARWEVEVKVTALFMNMFHRHLNGPFPQPARALREAQAWMLNPDREVPGEWPKALRDEAAMAGRPGGADLAAPRAWAAFTYQGQ